MNKKMLFLLVMIIVFGAVEFSLAEIPSLINYQGKLTDSTGISIDTTIAITFNIYALSSGGTSLWSEEHPSIEVKGGIFDVLLGSITPLPENLLGFQELWLGTTFGNDEESTPRKLISSVPYSMNAGNARDTYNGSKDLMPNSKVKVFVYPRYSDSKVTLYLHGEGFAGTVLAHTHTGTNPHNHSFSGTTGYESVDHTHSYSGTTGLQSADHVHSGQTGSTDMNLSHSHSGNADNGGRHRHDLLIHGYDQDGFFIVHRSDVTALTADGGPALCVASASVDLNQSNHSHTLSIDPALGLISHSHSFTSGGVSANHSHAYSGISSGRSAAHTHNITGTTSTDGSGLALYGVVAGTLPSGVKVYVDGVATPGSWSGQFSTGAIDLSSYIADTQEHAVEIREEGGTGGQIVYTLFVE
jgi:hypothetical protein